MIRIAIAIALTPLALTGCTNPPNTAIGVVNVSKKTITTANKLYIAFSTLGAAQVASGAWSKEAFKTADNNVYNILLGVRKGAFGIEALTQAIALALGEVK